MDCPFCSLLNSDRPVKETTLSLAVEDAFPISPGHHLVVPKRHVASIFELDRREVHDLLELTATVRSELLRLHDPNGFNIGVNDGAAAGQTIGHAHVHVIPRRDGDVIDPRGGIRWVLPEKAVYWSST